MTKTKQKQIPKQKTCLIAFLFLKLWWTSRLPQETDLILGLSRQSASKNALSIPKLSRQILVSNGRHWLCLEQFCHLSLSVDYCHSLGSCCYQHASSPVRMESNALGPWSHGLQFPFKPLLFSAGFLWTTDLVSFE